MEETNEVVAAAETVAEVVIETTNDVAEAAASTNLVDSVTDTATQAVSDIAASTGLDQVPELLEKVQEWLAVNGMAFAGKLIAAIVIFIVGKWVANLVRKGIKKIMLRSKVDDALISFTCSIAYFGMLTFVVIAALSKLGVETASLAVIFGGAALAIGLALQGSLSNFASGVLMLIFRPFKIGDYIEGGGVSGSVKDIEIFTTTLTSPDNKQIIVPNAKIMGDNIINYSGMGKRRLDLVAGVGYGDDLDKVRKVLEGIIADDKRVLKDPEPFIGVSELADSSVNFVVRPWVTVADYWPCHFALTEQIKKRFDAEGISIPFPQQDVHIIKEDA